jgi:integrase
MAEAAKAKARKAARRAQSDFEQERNFYRDLWRPAQKASGLDIRPHECRHSYVTHLRAAGVNDADLAEIAGHRVETMLARYTHVRPAAAMGQFEARLAEPIADGTSTACAMIRGCRCCIEAWRST